jgi:rubrerythrin
MNRETDVRRRQSLEDIAIQETGHLETVFELALRYTSESEENGESDESAESKKRPICITSDLEVGAAITSETCVVKSYVDYYDRNEIKPATAVTIEEMDAIAPLLEGIDYWMLEGDFIVTPPFVY